MNGGIGDIFWIFLVWSMVQPWLQKKMLDSGRNARPERLSCRPIRFVFEIEFPDAKTQGSKI